MANMKDYLALLDQEAELRNTVERLKSTRDAFDKQSRNTPPGHHDRMGNYGQTAAAQARYEVAQEQLRELSGRIDAEWRYLVDEFKATK